MSRGKRSAVAVILGLFVLSLAGCMIIAGSEEPQVHRPNTLGQELRDLKTARDEGAIEDEQYRAARQKLIASYDKR